jgi:tRNA nucleotidyltransferase/poly(A) polymerase
MPRIDISVLERDLLLKGVWESLGAPRCLVTGGYLRDRLLGRATTDLDLVLPGTADEARGPAQRLAARLDASAHLLGRGENRVWRIDTSGLKVELWPLGRLDLERDIRRRDFSINALMWPLPAGPLDDRVGALADLEDGVLRAVARRNLVEDPVRLARAARFLAQLPGLELEPRTAGWIRSLAPRLRRAPRERLGQELLRLVTAAGAERGLRALLELGLLTQASPSTTSCDPAWLGTNVEAASRLRPAAHPQKAALAVAGDAAPLALLLRAWGSPHADAVASYAWPRTVRHHAARAASMLDETLVVMDGPAANRRAFIHRAGSAFPTAVALAAAVAPTRDWSRWWRLWREHGEEIVLPTPLLSGEEVAAVLDVSPGPILGRAVDALTDAQVRAQVRTRHSAVRWLRRWARDGL